MVRCSLLLWLSMHIVVYTYIRTLLFCYMCSSVLIFFSSESCIAAPWNEIPRFMPCLVLYCSCVISSLFPWISLFFWMVDIIISFKRSTLNNITSRYIYITTRALKWIWIERLITTSDIPFYFRAVKFLSQHVLDSFLVWCTTILSQTICISRAQNARGECEGGKRETTWKEA